MLTLLMLAAFAGQDASAPMSTAPTAVPTSVSAPFDVTVLDGSVAAPDCGGRSALAAQAFCVSLPKTALETIGPAYLSDLLSKGWMAESMDGARLLMVRRRAEGGCDGLQLLGLEPKDASDPTVHIAFGQVPTDVCARPPASTPGLPEPTRPAS